MSADSTSPPYLGRGARSPYPLSTHIWRLLWQVVWTGLFRPSPRRCYGFRRILLRCFGAKITGRVSIYPTVQIYFPWNLVANGPLLVGPGVNLYNLSPLTLARGCIISQGAHLCAGTHDYNRLDFPLIFEPMVIGENVWVAAEAFVGPGVSIGEWSVIGARSVVVKSIPPRVVAAGNPCRVLKARELPPGA